MLVNSEVRVSKFNEYELNVCMCRILMINYLVKSYF